jgi:hypothetical protein
MASPRDTRRAQNETANNLSIETIRSGMQTSNQRGTNNT